MNLSDPIGDMLTRIRNGHQARLASVHSPLSKFRTKLLDVLVEEGYIEGYEVLADARPESNLKIQLKYSRDGIAVIREIKRVSKPGRRVYSRYNDILNSKFRNGLGIKIVSTSKGVMSDRKARQLKLGGEIICNIF